MASSTQAAGQAIEAKYDRIMKRTQDRPIANGKLSKSTGLGIAAALGSVSIGVFSHFGVPTTLCAASIWMGYIGLYIPLKRVTRFNTHIGAAIGSMPVYLGWIAGTGHIYGLQPFFMYCFMFAWQFPHFYGILWAYKDDFKKAGHKMITDTDINGKVTYRGALLGSIGQLVSCFGLAFTGNINPYFLPFALLYCYGSNANSLKEFKSVKNI